MMKRISLFYQMILDSNYLSGVLYATMLIAIIGSQLMIGKITLNDSDVTPPDMWYGCNSEQLSTLFHRIGDTRREIYIFHCYYDFFPGMPLYMMLVTVLSLKSRNYLLSSLNGGHGSIISSIIKHQYYEWMLLLLPPITVISDIFETYTYLYAAKQFPNSISSKHAMIGNIGNKGKWNLLMTIFSLIIFQVTMGYYYRSTLSSSSSSKKTK